MGPAYNGKIYERRLEVLNQMLTRHLSKSIDQLRVLDIGCGSGFYTAYWAAEGVQNYFGIDISSLTIKHLSSEYPDYTFINADITAADIPAIEDLGSFDVVTVFDVFYHIVDDRQFSNAVGHIGDFSGRSGCVFVMDHLYSDRYQLSKHVLYRDRDEYLSIFERSGLGLVDDELLFHFLVPPLSGFYLIDYLTAGIFKLTGMVVRTSDRLAGWVATMLSHLDARLRAAGRNVSNCEMLVFKKTEA